MPIPEPEFLRASENVLNSLKRRRLEGIEKEVYNLLTYRHVQEPKNFDKDFVTYEKKLNESAKHLNGEHRTIWLAINHLKTNAGNTSYKEYFTFRPNGIRQAMEFLELMPKLKEELNKLNGNASFKFPNGYDFLLTHNDSLVIHYANERQGLEIRRIVQKLFEEKNLQLTPRTNRVETGFDLKLGGTWLSHSEIISGIVANGIREHRNEFQNLNREEFAKKLLEELHKANALNVQQVRERLENRGS